MIEKSLFHVFHGGLGLNVKAPMGVSLELRGVRHPEKLVPRVV